MKRVLFPLLFAAVFLHAQNPKSPKFPTTVAADGDLFVANNRPASQKTLNGSITSGATSIVLSDATGYAAPIIITVESEIIYCSTLVSATLSGCVRGQEGTSAAAHNSGVNVYDYLTAGYANQVAAEVKAIETALAARKLNYIAGGGTAQAQTADPLPPVASLANGLGVCWLPSNANSGAAPTLAVNGLTAKPITKLGTTALVANDLTTTAIACALYDGTEFQLQNPQTNTGAGGSAAITLTTVSFSATPTFTRSTSIQEWVLTLTGNVTSSTLSGASAGDILVFNLIQDGTGGRTFVWPTGFAAAETCTISPTASIATKKIFYWDGSAAHALTPCVTTVSTSDLVITDGANTGTSAFTLDASAASGANAFKIPVAAGATATGNGAQAYDSTNNMLHAAQSGADAKIPQFTVTPTNGDCATWVVSGSNYKLGDAACGSGGGANFTTANQQYISFMGGTFPFLNGAQVSDMTVNVVYCFMVPAQYSITVSKLYAYTVLGATAGKATAMGIYDASGNRLQQGVVVTPSGQPQAFTLGASQNIVIQTTYYFCAATEDTGSGANTASTFRGIVDSAASASNYNAGTALRIVTAANASSGTGAGFALPSTLGALTANNAATANVPYMFGTP